MIDGKIAQNWVLMDIVDIFHQLGIDLFDLVDKITHKTVFELPNIPRKNHANSAQDLAFKNTLLQTKQ